MDLISRLEQEFKGAVTITAAGGDDAVDGVRPQAVATPRDEETAAALVAWCGREKVPFVPRGGGSKLGIGAPPIACDLVISTAALNQVVEHDEGNATVAAGAGIPLAELNRRVGEHGQFVPLDDATGNGPSTLGGAAATNWAGPSRLKYGAPRDLVVGLHAVLPDGRVVKAGSKVVKNVSGYDLNKIFIGSFGTLGLITEVTIRLRPHDIATATWYGHYENWDDAAQQAQSIMNGGFVPTTLRLIAQPGRLSIEARFDGVESAVQTQLKRLPASAPALEYSIPVAPLVVRAGLPLQSASAWAQEAKRRGASHIEWDCGIGSVRAYFEEIPSVINLVDALREAAVASDGFVVVEKAPPLGKSATLVWGNARPDFKWMQRLKQSYDAANVCAPGRFIGGL